MENSEHSISYQEFGKPESFVGGKLALSQPLQKPRWFKSGVTLCDISTQLEIVDALIGREPELAENTIDRREKNYGSFFKEVDNTTIKMFVIFWSYSSYDHYMTSVNLS